MGDNVEARVGLLRATTLKLGLGCYSYLLGTTVLRLHGQLGQVREATIQGGGAFTSKFPNKRTARKHEYCGGGGG
jgi:hypothetical protein